MLLKGIPNLLGRSFLLQAITFIPVIKTSSNVLASMYFAAVHEPQL